MDVTRAELEQKLKGFEQALRSAVSCNGSTGRTLAVLHFSGHGGLSVVNRETTELVFLKDTALSSGAGPAAVDESAYSVPAMIQFMRGAHTALVFVDACQALMWNEGSQCSRLAANRRLVQRRLIQRLSTPRQDASDGATKLLIAYGCRRGATALDEADGGSWTSAALQVPALHHFRVTHVSLTCNHVCHDQARLLLAV